MRPIFLFALLFPFLAACQPVSSKPVASNDFIQGHAKVIEVHQELGYALLAIDGKPVYAYWATDPAVSPQTTLNHNGPWGSATGEVKEPVVYHQHFPANPGDTIAFRGQKTGSDILLRGVEVLSH